MMGTQEKGTHHTSPLQKAVVIRKREGIRKGDFLPFLTKSVCNLANFLPGGSVNNYFHLFL